VVGLAAAAQAIRIDLQSMGCSADRSLYLPSRFVPNRADTFSDIEDQSRALRWRRENPALIQSVTCNIFCIR